MKKVCFSLLFLFLMLIPVSASADDMVYGTFSPEYHYTEARRMLAIVNNHRVSNGRQALVYDYELEKLAALRAAEILVSFSHTRPNGQNWSTVFNNDDYHPNYGHWGENICEGCGSAEDAFSAFRNSRSHNDNMLRSDYKYVAFACAEVGGSWHWVQLFHTNRSASYPDTYYTYPIDGRDNVTVEMTKDKVSLEAVPDHVSFDYYEDPALPDVYRKYGKVRGRKMNLSWTVDDSSIAGIENGKLIWRKAGETNIRATDDLGKTVTVHVYCGAVIISSATANMDGKYPYTGSPVEPKPVLTFRGETLKENVDYTIQYDADHTNPGRKNLTVVGMGRFRNTMTLNYEIGKKSQTVTASISPSTLKVGETAKISSSGVGNVSYKAKSSNVYVYSDGTVGAYSAGTGTIQVSYSGDAYTEAGSTDVSVTFEAAPAPASSGGSSGASGASGGSPGVTTTTTTSKSGSYSNTTTENVWTKTVTQDPITVAITPASVKAKGKKGKAVISWRKLKKKQKRQIQSIQVQASIDPAFEGVVYNLRLGKNVTKVTMKLQRKQTYYVRVRYVGNGGVSAWSAVKRVKTK